MIRCGKARSMLVEHTRERVSESGLLQLDQHLAVCAECRVERARWETIGAMKEWQPPSLGGAARERIVARLKAARVEVAAPARAPFRPVLAFAGLALAAVVVVVMWPRPPTEIAARKAGTMQVAGARLDYRAGTVAHVKKDSVALEAGELEVTGKLRVSTKNWIVQLTQAHVVFAPYAVRVLAGEAHVFSLEGRELATLTGGQEWPAKAVAAAPAPATPSMIAPVVAAPAAPEISATTLLSRARASLAAGDAREARRFIARALAASPSQHDRAEAELFTAESYLVEQQPRRAVEEYRKVAAAFSRLPEGEAAAFAAAQVLSEVEPVDAHEAFRAYLDRYPEGRFAREARDHLAGE